MKLILIAAFAALFALPAAAHEGVHVIDPYARVIGPSGVVFFRIENHADVDDTLVSVTSPDAGMVMLMNDSAGADGVMKMTSVPDGFPVAAQSARVLASAADHVMLMDLTRKIKQGDRVTVILTFQKAGQVMVTVPVDNTRRTDPGEVATEYDAKSP